MSDPFVGQITGFGGNFAPRGWAFCDGQLMAISQNDALFSLLGTYYGGDGRTSFGLPDLRGRTSVHPGTGAGLSPIRVGQTGGLESVTLSVNQLPSHTHTALMHAENKGGNQNTPAGNMLGRSGQDTIYTPPDAKDNVALAASSITLDASGGNSAPVTNRGPSLGINMIIALYGVYPSRN